MNLLLISIFLLPSILAISLIDWLVLSRWARCDKCGFQDYNWYMWIVPTIMEILCLFVGVLIGLSIAGVVK